MPDRPYSAGDFLKRRHLVEDPGRRLDYRYRQNRSRPFTQSHVQIDQRASAERGQCEPCTRFC